MLTELRKYAATSSALRKLALEKEAGLLGAVGKAGLGIAKRVGSYALANPLKTTTAVLGGAATIGQAKRTSALFNPAVHRAQLGIQP